MRACACACASACACVCHPVCVGISNIRRDMFVTVRKTCSLTNLACIFDNILSVNVPNIIMKQLGTHKQRLFVYYITGFLIVSSKITVSLYQVFLVYIIWASIMLKAGAVVFDLETPKICLVASFASLILRQDIISRIYQISKKY